MKIEFISFFCLSAKSFINFRDDLDMFCSVKQDGSSIHGVNGNLS